MGVPGNANPLLLASQDTQYTVARSLRFNSSDSAYLSRTPSSAGNRKKWTWAGWVKRVVIGQAFEYLLDAGVADNFGFTANSAYVYFGSGALGFKQSSAVFRDPGAWLHYLISFDSANSTAEDRCQIWINGVRLTSWSSNPTIPLNFESNINSTSTHTMCHALGYSFMSTYLAEIHFIDGQALTPSSFTEVSATTRQLIPKAYTGSYGTNGFKLDFSNNASTTTVSQDSSGNNNHWTANNISVAAGAGNDSLVDTPTSYGTDTGVGGEVRGNYCTWNPLDLTSQSLVDGNLAATGSSDSGGVTGTIGVDSGKWYWEVTCGTAQDDVGIWPISSRVTSYPGGTSTSYGYYGATGNKINSALGSAYGSTFGSGDVIGVALDLSAGTLVFYKNGVSQGTAFSGLTGGFRPAVRAGAASAANTTGAHLNAGQRPFAYTAPSGFKALVDTNIPVVIAKPSTVFDTTLWTGTNGANARTISGLSLSPDLVWIKVRNQAYSHQLFDAVRGTTKTLLSNSTSAEITNDASGTLTAFNSDGFTLSPVTNNNSFNTLNDTYVAWCWDAGSSNATNTQGSITSTVRANPSAGFSVVTWTGTGTTGTIGHGLGVAPRFYVIKSRSTANNWVVGTTALDGSLDIFFLNTTSGKVADAGEAVPTSTVISVANANDQNANGVTYVCYAWAPVSGYSSFGSYTGNGSADGPFVYTGHRSRFLLIKRSDGGANYWSIIDTARSTGNVANAVLYPNATDAESTSNFSMDVLSNGFKLRSTSSDVNVSNGTYIFASFAENPFQYARAR